MGHPLLKYYNEKFKRMKIVKKLDLRFLDIEMYLFENIWKDMPMRKDWRAQRRQ